MHSGHVTDLHKCDFFRIYRTGQCLVEDGSSVDLETTGGRSYQSVFRALYGIKFGVVGGCAVDHSKPRTMHVLR